MKYLADRRDTKKLTQLGVAQAAGMSRAHYQRIESGLALASAEQARALEAVLGVPVLSEKQLIRSKERLELCRAGLLRVEDRSRATWAQAARNWGFRGLDASTWSQLSFFFESGSARECGGLVQLAAAGAKVRLDSPLLWGFDRLVPVDQNDRFLGAAHLPCLVYDEEKVTFALWPQFRLRPADVTWCLDGLLFFRHANSRRWLNLEFDGGGHDARNDLYRAYQLQLPEVRITGEEIGAGEVFRLLMERAPVAQLPDFSPLRRR